MLSRFIYFMWITAFALYGAAEESSSAVAGFPTYIKQEKILLQGAQRFYIWFSFLNAIFRTERCCNEGQSCFIDTDMIGVMEGTDEASTQEAVRVISRLSVGMTVPEGGMSEFNTEILKKIHCHLIEHGFAQVDDIRMEAVWFTVLNRGTPSAIVCEHEPYSAYNRKRMRTNILPPTAQEQLHMQCVRRRTEPKHETIMLEFDAKAYLKSCKKTRIE